MFKLLKDKLKKWVFKAEEGDEIVEKPIEDKKILKEEKITQRKVTKEGKKSKHQEKKEEKKEILDKKKEEREKKKVEKKEKKQEEKLKVVEKEEVEKSENKQEKQKKGKGLTEEKFKQLFEELQMVLLQNNVAYSAIEDIEYSLKEKLIGGNKKTSVEDALKESIKELLIDSPDLIQQIKEKKEKPFVILFAGINGAGKTTTLAKIANLLKKNKLSLCVAACDTFRAASIEQLKVHTDRLDVPLISKDYGADPASVGYDAINYAKKNKLDVVLIDTAGRMNNRDSLMKEIEKICRVNKPDLKIFLGESITGNDATTQAKDFNDAIDLDGIILSKADVDEKGGTAISVSKVTGKPIYYLGTGQAYDDLEKFDKNKLIEKMFD